MADKSLSIVFGTPIIFNPFSYSACLLPDKSFSGWFFSTSKFFNKGMIFSISLDLNAASASLGVICFSKTTFLVPRPRYKASLDAITYLSEVYPITNAKAQFRGLAYSDEIELFTTFNSQTGNPVEVSSIDSSSLFLRFSKWIESLIPDQKSQPSSPGEALDLGLLRAKDISNSLPTLILFFSSGIHTSGPNPVKIVKSHGDISPILCFVPGKKSNHDLMEAIAEISHGKTIIVEQSDDIKKITDAIADMLAGGS